MNNKEGRVFSVAFHGHSVYSDGSDDIGVLVAGALRREITYFGVSDHNTTRGVPLLYRCVDRINQRVGTCCLVPVAAIELRTKQGDIVVAKPGPLDQNFISWADKMAEKCYTKDVSDIVVAATEIHNALVVIVHPGALFLPSVSLALLRQLGETLDARVLENLGVEVRNWTTGVMGPFNVYREDRVAKIVKKLNLAEMGFSDFHHVSQIEKVRTQFESDKTTPTPEDLMEAVRQRKTLPVVAEEMGVLSWVQAVSSCLKSS